MATSLVSHLHLTVASDAKSAAPASASYQDLDGGPAGGVRARVNFGRSSNRVAAAVVAKVKRPGVTGKDASSAFDSVQHEICVRREGAAGLAGPKRNWRSPQSMLSKERPVGTEGIEASLALARRSLDSALAGSSLQMDVAHGAFIGKQAQPSQRQGERGTEAVAVDIQTDDLWLTIRAEARGDSEAEPALASYLYSTILAHRSLERALAFHLANKLSSSTFLSTQLFSLIVDTFMADEDVRRALRADMHAVRERDPSCATFSQCMLNFKGYQALQSHRVAHRLWRQGREALALAIQSRVSEVFHMDIHPAANIGEGILFDHGTGIVIGETAEIGNNVSMLHHVTLGGTGAAEGARHPKVEDGVLIGAGATVLGNVTIGAGAKIGAGSLVLIDIPPRTTAVGNPARLVGGKKQPVQLEETPSETMDHTSFIGQWSDYII